MDTRRTVFGFTLDSPFPLRTARHGYADHDIRVEVGDAVVPSAHRPLMRWTPNPTNALKADLYETSDGGSYILDIADTGAYRVAPGERLILVPPSGDGLQAEVRLLGLPLLLCFLERGDLSLHAAAIEGPDGAVLIAAPGRHGKTSLAATLVKQGYRLLTEDLCCIRPGNPPLLLPGPASLRVRPDMAPHILPVAGMEEIGMLEDRLVLTATDPGTCDAVPINAVVFLKDFGDRLEVDPADSLQALPDLWLLSLHLPSEADRTRKFGQLVELVEGTAVWNVILDGQRKNLERSAEALLDQIRDSR